MKKYFLLFFLLSLIFLEKVSSLSISSSDADKIGLKIWKNECAGTIDGLTNWKKGENFASFGIGHFIWYPAGRKESFQETFPDLLQFFLKKGVTLPSWLKADSACPWNTRDSFYEDFHSPKMECLRKFLLETRSIQAIFIANRLEMVLPGMIEACPEEDRDKITNLFNSLIKDPNGLYAMLDYLNFKGSGISSKETYKGQGWGLLQVLQRTQSPTQQPLIDFVAAAKNILNQRVLNSPPERHEEQWLKGWLNRLNTYIETPKM